MRYLLCLLIWSLFTYLQLACCRSGPPHSQDSVNRLPLIGHAGHCRRWPCFFVSVMNKCLVMMSTILIISGTLVWALYMQPTYFLYWEVWYLNYSDFGHAEICSSCWGFTDFEVDFNCRLCGLFLQDCFPVEAKKISSQWLEDLVWSSHLLPLSVSTMQCWVQVDFFSMVEWVLLFWMLLLDYPSPSESNVFNETFIFKGSYCQKVKFWVCFFFFFLFQSNSKFLMVVILNKGQ